MGLLLLEVEGGHKKGQISRETRTREKYEQKAEALGEGPYSPRQNPLQFPPNPSTSSPKSQPKFPSYCTALDLLPTSAS